MMSEPLFRLESFARILKKSGLITDLVNKGLSSNIAEDKLNFTRVSDLNLGPGTKVLFPENPVHQDGSVNIMFQFRGGSNQLFTQAGVNSVIVMADAGGIGGGPSRKAFGSSNFVNNSINTILKYISNKINKPTKLGKLGLSGWSGGYDPIHGIMSDNYSGKPLIKQPDYVGLFDGMHHSIRSDSPAMAVWEKLAREAENGNTQFVITHTAVKPDNYPSTTDTTNYLLNRLSVNRAPINNQSPKYGPKPISVANKGGLSIYQLYDKSAPYMINGKANVPGTSGYQHIQALKALPSYWPKNW